VNAIADRRLRELARRVANLEKTQRIRTPQLTHSSLEDGALLENDRDGNLVQVIGKQFDGTHLAASVGGPNPPQVTAPTVTPKPGGVVVKWDGLWENDSAGNPVVAPMDWLRTDVSLSTDVAFDPIATPPTASIVAARGGEVFLALPAVEHHFALVARSLSGKAGTPSTKVAATPQAPTTGAGGVKTYYSDTAPIGLTTADEGSIWYDTASGNRENRWNGDDWQPIIIGGQALSASAIDGFVITGATIRTAAGGRRIEQDSLNGFRVIAATGELLVHFPTAEGSENRFEGDIIARGITAYGNVQIRGTTNEISASSSITMQAGVTPPSSPPLVTSGVYGLQRSSGLAGLDPQALAAPGVQNAEFVGLCYMGGGYYFAIVGNKLGTRTPTTQPYRFYRINKNTGAYNLLWTTGSDMVLSYGITSVCQIGVAAGTPRFVIGSREGFNAQGTQVGTTFRVYSYDPATMAISFLTLWELGQSGCVAFADPNGTTPDWSVLVANRNTDTGMVQLTPRDGRDGSSQGATFQTVVPYQIAEPDGGASAGKQTVQCGISGNFDYGAPRIILCRQDDDGQESKNSVLNRDGTAALAPDGVSAEYFYSWRPRTVHWASDDPDGARFWTIERDPGTDPAQWRQHGINRYFEYVRAKYSWADHDAGGTGQHESGLSAASTTSYHSLYPRGAVLVDVPKPNDLGGVDDPNGVILYLQRATKAEVDAGGGNISTVLNGKSYLKAGAVDLTGMTASTATLWWQGAAPSGAYPTYAPFPNSVAAEFKSATGGFIVRGDGSGAWPALTDAQRAISDARYLRVDDNAATKLLKAEGPATGRSSVNITQDDVAARHYVTGTGTPGDNSSSWLQMNDLQAEIAGVNAANNYVSRFRAQVDGGVQVFGNWVDRTDQSWAGVFSGTVTFLKIGNLVFVFGAIDRATNFNATYVDTGIVAPVGYRPPAQVQFTPGAFVNTSGSGSTGQYQFRVISTGELQCRQAAASTQTMGVYGMYIVA